MNNDKEIMNENKNLLSESTQLMKIFGSILEKTK